MKNNEALLYAFCQYIKNIDKEVYEEAVSLCKNECFVKTITEAYEIAINNLKLNCKSELIYKIKNVFDPNQETYFQFKEISLDESLILRDNNRIIEKKQWKEYILKVIKLIKNNLGNYTKVYYLLMKYTSNIPAVNSEDCVISLFDICKNTAAIYYALGENSDNLVLIKGDFSGIQKFIFKVGTENGLKGLKGRSLYLSILQDLVSKYIVNELNLDITNILYSGGGNFYILASGKHIEEIEQIRKRLSEMILDKHKGEIYISLAYKEFNKNKFQEFSNVWQEIGDEAGKKKNKKWSELGLKDNFEKIFGPLESNKEVKGNICNLCGRKITNLEEDNQCDFCRSYVELVEESKKANVFIEEKIAPKDEEKNTYEDVFSSLGYKISFGNNKIKANDKELVYLINDTGDDDFKGYDGFIFKSIKLTNKSLDELAISNNELGDKKIGVLKLDVDNLGKVFINAKSLAEVMALSRNMGMFFEGFIEKIIEKDMIPISMREFIKTRKWKDKITIIYAGGDDTFVVGRYDEVFEFTSVLREHFRNYVGTNLKTFSAGLGMFSTNYPIRISADITEEFLDRGKNTEGKDKICFMGQVFTWTQFNELIKLKNNIEEIYDLSPSNSLFQKIDNSTKGFKSVFNNNGSVSGIKLYRLAYYLRDLKNGEKKELSSKVESLVNKYEHLCLDAIVNKDARQMAMIIPYANKWAKSNCRKLVREEI